MFRPNLWKVRSQLKTPPPPLHDVCVWTWCMLCSQRLFACMFCVRLLEQAERVHPSPLVTSASIIESYLMPEEFSEKNSKLVHAWQVQGRKCPPFWLCSCLGDGTMLNMQYTNGESSKGLETAPPAWKLDFWCNFIPKECPSAVGLDPSEVLRRGRELCRNRRGRNHDVNGLL